MKDFHKEKMSVRVESGASQSGEFMFVTHWVSKFIPSALVVESVASCVPLIFFKEVFQNHQYCFGVVWYYKALSIEEYFNVFLRNETKLERTPPCSPFETASMKVYAVYIRGKFGERELLMRIAVGAL